MIIDELPEASDQTVLSVFIMKLNGTL